MSDAEIQKAPPRFSAAASIGALGIVYGDIGTSPLYALKEAVKAAAAGGSPDAAAVIGAVSVILWSLIVVVSLKYAVLILRADNRGEGGIVAMLALLRAREAQPGTARGILLIFGLIGAALLYGDGAITPAISVLSAVEGLKVDAPSLTPLVLPITVVVLVALFLVQHRGTAFIGRVFGPIMVCWFLALGVLGFLGIVRAPAILQAINPWAALGFMIHAGPGISFAILGAAFLAVTGGEAMYADMGHFGRSSIRQSWFAIVLPCLVLNYLGQGGLLLADPTAIENPFYQLSPDWLHYPLVVFATAATVIASQAIISGAFSLTQQAIQLGFLPKMHVTHTAPNEIGQIYLPLVNWLLAAATLGGRGVVRLLRCAGGGLRHRGLGPDGDHDGARGTRRRAMGLSPGRGRGAERRVLRRRPRVLRRQFREAVRRRLVPADPRPDRRVPDADLAARHHDPRIQAHGDARAGGEALGPPVRPSSCGFRPPPPISAPACRGCRFRCRISCEPTKRCRSAC